ncbi:uv excision repair protein rad23 [Anaeramoeba ignava]|uniref:Uv excision repair protein rad23 n=1 Tax=Anaeramoeba ignava TaxID=1746090 RepID=A0A9Q0LBS9_ANAIG|nr:uv excision repair protein rad23 [Anaeramoeba ignava]
MQKILIKTISNQNYPIFINLNETVSSLKEKIEYKIDISRELQKLIWKDQLLEDSKTLSSYGVLNEDEVLLIFKVKKKPVLISDFVKDIFPFSLIEESQQINEIIISIKKYNDLFDGKTYELDLKTIPIRMSFWLERLTPISEKQSPSRHSWLNLSPGESIPGKVVTANMNTFEEGTIEIDEINEKIIFNPKKPLISKFGYRCFLTSSTGIKNSEFESLTDLCPSTFYYDFIWEETPNKNPKSIQINQNDLEIFPEMNPQEKWDQMRFFSIIDDPNINSEESKPLEKSLAKINVANLLEFKRGWKEYKNQIQILKEQFQQIILCDCGAFVRDTVLIPCGHTFCRKCAENCLANTCRKCFTKPEKLNPFHFD